MNDERGGGKTWVLAGLMARVLVGGVLIAAGASKRAKPPEEFAVVIEAYDIAPQDSVQSLSVLLPWAELLVGFSLLFGFLTPAASAAAAAMFSGFLLALLSTKFRHIPLPDCGCFGQGLHLPTTVTIALDALLLLPCSLLSLRQGARFLSLDAWVGRKAPRALGPKTL
ncbi:MAG: DoxX family membrane protein [Elusimicrobia bacterium]|nr:DoxX family membrane protein [Elusimicrobiota bacterium]